MVQMMLDALSGIPDELVIFIISMLPILELRGGLVAAAILNVNPWVALPICFLGNMLPIPFILLFIRKILSYLKKTKLFKKLVNKIEKKAEKNKKKISSYVKWSLFIFVALPLPGTGGWTGALVADALDIHVKKSFWVIALGVLTAGVIMTILSYTSRELFLQLFA